MRIVCCPVASKSVSEINISVPVIDYVKAFFGNACLFHSITDEMLECEVIVVSKCIPQILIMTQVINRVKYCGIVNAVVNILFRAGSRDSHVNRDRLGLPIFRFDINVSDVFAGFPSML